MKRHNAVLLALTLSCTTEDLAVPSCLEAAGPLCTRVLFEGLPEAAGLSADEGYAALVSEGVIYVVRLADGVGQVIEPQEGARFSTPAVSEGWLAAKQLRHDEVFEYVVMTVAGERIATAAAAPFAPKHLNEFEAFPLGLAGDYLAHFTPTPDADWELVVSQLVTEEGGVVFKPLRLGKGGAASEIALDKDGRVLRLMSDAGPDEGAWDKRTLELIVPNWAGATPRMGAPIQIVAVEWGIQVGWPSLRGDLVLYELTATRVPGGSGLASAIFLTDLDPLGADWLIEAQGTWEQEMMLWAPSLGSTMLGWLDGRIDPDSPAVALRRFELTQPEHRFQILEDYALYPPAGGRVTEFALAGEGIVWLMQEGDAFTLYFTEIR